MIFRDELLTFYTISKDGEGLLSLGWVVESPHHFCSSFMTYE